MTLLPTLQLNGWQSIQSHCDLPMWRRTLILCLVVLPALAAAEADTEVSLREYVDTRFEAQEKAAAVALAAVKEASVSAQSAADRAVAKAEAATDKRFESVNEFRAALDDNTRTLMPRAEAEQQFKAIIEKIDDLTKRMAAKEEQGRGLNQGWLILVALTGVLATGVGVYMALRTRRPASSTNAP